MPPTIIGIDPGEHTGISVYSEANKSWTVYEMEFKKDNLRLVWDAARLFLDKYSYGSCCDFHLVVEAQFMQHNPAVLIWLAQSRAAWECATWQRGGESTIVFPSTWQAHHHIFKTPKKDKIEKFIEIASGITGLARAVFSPDTAAATLMAKWYLETGGMGRRDLDIQRRKAADENRD
jgi:Holliday junction resolvasome RuvABC endonuclease subunit